LCLVGMTVFDLSSYSLYFSPHRNNSYMLPIATDGVAWSESVSMPV